MKLFKRIISVIPLLVGVLVLYGAMTGKLTKLVEKSKEKSDQIVSDVKEKAVQNNDKDIPEGKIVLKKYFKQWEINPRVEEYDPDNKIPSNGVYGMTREESDHRNACYMKQNRIKDEMIIPSEYIGEQIYNNEKLKTWGETFEIEFTNSKHTYDNFRITDNFKELDSKYFAQDKQNILEDIDSDGKLAKQTVKEFAWEGENRIVKTIPEVECKLLMFDITIESYSDWVVESEVVPEMIYLNEDEEGTLFPIEEIYASSDGEIEICLPRPVYYTLDLYDYDRTGSNENIYCYPMRKSEKVKFTVGYIVPDFLIERTYFVYNPDCYTSTQYSFAAQDLAIFKAGNKEEKIND